MEDLANGSKFTTPLPHMDPKYVFPNVVSLAHEFCVVVFFCVCVSGGNCSEGKVHWNGHSVPVYVETYVSRFLFGTLGQSMGINYLHPLAIVPLKTLQHVYLNSSLEPFWMGFDAFPSANLGVVVYPGILTTRP